MKLSESWLREWVSPALTHTELAAQLTMAGLEVDGIYPVAGQFTKVVVARIVKSLPHPQADKLTLCEVDIGSGALMKVVCGAANVRTGLMVAMALADSTLPSGIIIKESMLRGHLSQGMLCSGAELGLEESSEGILELGVDALIGMDLRDYLSLDDCVFDFNLTPNRADCFSVLGVAREMAVLNGLKLQYPISTFRPEFYDESLTIDVHEPASCPHYCSRVIRSINLNASTPVWMKERLRRSNIRAIHPVVDVMNYVMLELGQPMHAFDLQKIDGNIQVRYAVDGETIMLLNQQTVALNAKVLIIADAHKPLAMAGIMGGEFSCIGAHTLDICLESAFFKPLAIGSVARQYNLYSDSSQRFERGVDPNLQILALERATELLLDIVGGAAGLMTVVTNPEFMPKKISISFRPTQVKKLSGIEIALSNMSSILEGLGMTIVMHPDYWLVEIPSHRFDLALEVDLIEEIVRLYGYNNIHAGTPIAKMKAIEPNLCEQLARRISMFLSARSYNEVINYSFVDPNLQDILYPAVQALQLLNPISVELSQMRVGLWPGLLASMIYNVHRQQASVKFFESGVVFDVNGDALSERACIAGLLSGQHGHLNWSETARNFDFYDMKGDLQALLASLNLRDIDFVVGDHPSLHPGQTACIVMGEVAIGWLGVLHPSILASLELKDDIMLFELSLEALTSKVPASYRHISRYPQIRRDLSFVVAKEISAAQIEQAVRSVVVPAWLKSLDIFDVYTGSAIPVDKKSLALALILQDDQRTLIDIEINQLIDVIIKKLSDEFNILLRE